MKINLEKDQKCNVDIQLCISVLNQLCKDVTFEALPVRTLGDYSSSCIDFPGELNRIQRRFGQYPADLHFLLTRRPFDDNYFAHSSDNIIVISFAHWEEYTGLPEENGFLHYVACYITLSLESLKRHRSITGCAFDFHQAKSGIDRCIREGQICSKCHHTLREAIGNSTKKEGVYRDVISILNTVANTSRLGRSVYTVLSDPLVGQLNWETFEDFVADYYRSLGAKVEQDCNLAGFQVDVLATELTSSGRSVRTLVECKFYKSKVGNRIVNEFCRVFATIREAGLTDAAVLVSYSGFTQDARLAAKHSNITLLHYKDIVQRLDEQDTSRVSTKFPKQTVKTELKSGRTVFVIMPFSSDFDDLYFFGIQSSVKDCKGVCIRMDEQEFNDSTVEEIYKNIERASVIIAEVSQPNLNVYYEVGYAHALRCEVILLTNDIKKTPFDLSGFNHLVYSSIRDLHEKLRRRLSALWTGQEIESNKLLEPDVG